MSLITKVNKINNISSLGNFNLLKILPNILELKRNYFFFGLFFFNIYSLLNILQYSGSLQCGDLMTEYIFIHSVELSFLWLLFLVSNLFYTAKDIDYSYYFFRRKLFIILYNIGCIITTISLFYTLIAFYDIDLQTQNFILRFILKFFNKISYYLGYSIISLFLKPILFFLQHILNVSNTMLDVLSVVDEQLPTLYSPGHSILSVENLTDKQAIIKLIEKLFTEFDKNEQTKNMLGIAIISRLLFIIYIFPFIFKYLQQIKNLIIYNKNNAKNNMFFYSVMWKICLIIFFVYQFMYFLLGYRLNYLVQVIISNITEVSFESLFEEIEKIILNLFPVLKIIPNIFSVFFPKLISFFPKLIFPCIRFITIIWLLLIIKRLNNTHNNLMLSITSELFMLHHIIYSFISVNTHFSSILTKQDKLYNFIGPKLKNKLFDFMLSDNMLGRIDQNQVTSFCVFDHNLLFNVINIFIFIVALSFSRQNFIWKALVISLNLTKLKAISVLLTDNSTVSNDNNIPIYNRLYNFFIDNKQYKIIEINNKALDHILVKNTSDGLNARMILYFMLLITSLLVILIFIPNINNNIKKTKRLSIDLMITTLIIISILILFNVVSLQLGGGLVNNTKNLSIQQILLHNPDIIEKFTNFLTYYNLNQFNIKTLIIYTRFNQQHS